MKFQKGGYSKMIFLSWVTHALDTSEWQETPTKPGMSCKVIYVSTNSHSQGKLYILAIGLACGEFDQIGQGTTGQSETCLGGPPCSDVECHCSIHQTFFDHLFFSATPSLFRMNRLSYCSSNTGRSGDGSG